MPFLSGNVKKRELLKIKMTDSAKTPSILASSSTVNDAFRLIRAIDAAEQDPDKPAGGVTIAREDGGYRGTFFFPVTRSLQADGEIVKIVDFIK